MKQRSGGMRACASVVVCLVGLLLAGLASAFADSGKSVLVLGRISDDPKAHYEQLRPLLDYVVPRMHDVGIREGRILMASDVQQMTSYLRRGRVDWVTETAGTAISLQQRAGAQPLLITERGGVSRYHSVFFARRDRGIASLQQLRGRTIAFQSRASTSAYLVPAITLLKAGLPLEILLSPGDTPSANALGYVFARSELNVASWVHKGLVDAGVVSSLDWQDPRRMPPAFREQLAVIHVTDEYPRALELVREGLDPKVQARLRQVLLEAAEDPGAREALLLFFRTTRFLPVDPESQAALDALGHNLARLRVEVE